MSRSPAESWAWRPARNSREVWHPRNVRSSSRFFPTIDRSSSAGPRAGRPNAGPGTRFRFRTAPNPSGGRCSRAGTRARRPSSARSGNSRLGTASHPRASPILAATASSRWTRSTSPPSPPITRSPSGPVFQRSCSTRRRPASGSRRVRRTWPLRPGCARKANARNRSRSARTSRALRSISQRADPFLRSFTPTGSSGDWDEPSTTSISTSRTMFCGSAAPPPHGSSRATCSAASSRRSRSSARWRARQKRSSTRSI